MILRDFSCRHCHFYIVSFKNFILFAIFSSTSSSKRAGISQAYQAQLSSVAAFTMNFGIKKEKVKADIDSLWWWSCQSARSVEGAAAAAVAAALFNFPFTLLLATLTLLVTHTVSWRVCVCVLVWAATLAAGHACGHNRKIHTAAVDVLFYFCFRLTYWHQHTYRGNTENCGGGGKMRQFDQKLSRKKWTVKNETTWKKGKNKKNCCKFIQCLIIKQQQQKEGLNNSVANLNFFPGSTSYFCQPAADAGKKSCHWEQYSAE